MTPADDETNKAVTTTFQVLSKFDVLVTSSLFAATTSRGSLSKHALSVIIASEHLARYLALHEVFADQLQQLACRMQALLDAVPAARAYECFGRNLEHICLQLERLATPPLVMPGALEATFFGERFGRALDAGFVARIVTSMLETQCSCVVAGSADVDNVNMLIRSLLLFVEPSDLPRCSLARAAQAVSGAPRALTAQFVPNLLVQGVVDVALSGVEGADSAYADDTEGVPGQADAGLRDECVLTAQLPSTLALLDAGLVRQTVRGLDYADARAECQRHAQQVLVAAAQANDAIDAPRWHARCAWCHAHTASRDA
jgi:hypothetical protein